MQLKCSSCPTEPQPAPHVATELSQLFPSAGDAVGTWSCIASSNTSVKLWCSHTVDTPQILTEGDVIAVGPSCFILGEKGEQNTHRPAHDTGSKSNAPTAVLDVLNATKAKMNNLLNFVGVTTPEQTLSTENSDIAVVAACRSIFDLTSSLEHAVQEKFKASWECIVAETQTDGTIHEDLNRNVILARQRNQWLLNQLETLKQEREELGIGQAGSAVERLRSQLEAATTQIKALKNELWLKERELESIVKAVTESQRGAGQLKATGMPEDVMRTLTNDLTRERRVRAETERRLTQRYLCIEKLNSTVKKLEAAVEHNAEQRRQKEAVLHKRLEGGSEEPVALLLEHLRDVEGQLRHCEALLSVIETRSDDEVQRLKETVACLTCEGGVQCVAALQEALVIALKRK